MDPCLSDLSCPYNSSANAAFPAKEYLKRFVDPTSDPMEVHSQFLKAWDYFYREYAGTLGESLMLLEFGGGPTLHSLITATKYVKSITFADYAETNRNEVLLWKNKTEGCHDWSAYFKYVVMELEKGEDDDLEKRQEETREKIKEVVACNIRDENILPSTQCAPFDIIHTNLCLEIACESVEEFTKCLSSLKEQLKPGGYLVCLTAKGGSWYTCAGTGCKLHQLKMEEDDIIQAFKVSGLKLVEYFPIKPKQNPLSATKEFQFTIAKNE